MRPTCLQFRNPKERTPDPYDIRVTCDGSPLDFKRTKSPIFGREQRFKQYDNEARKTGFRIGPGSYSQKGDVKIKGGLAYKPLHIAKGDIKDCYYVGHLLVRDSSSKLTKAIECEWNKKIELSRPTTASDAHYSPHKFHIRKGSPLNRNRSKQRLTPKID